jgi:hypothetical protein
MLSVVRFSTALAMFGPLMISLFKKPPRMGLCNPEGRSERNLRLTAR